ncbi:unnamed protein product [Acanthosepion pharaonis]|uniref:Uncharacterized protein n=1 Tax=Acanthosepion pharaonis TaxID=158019 RepID=A0A812EN67_ACAPH|nr:unnamed protein product [Sepia pharaonis]
MYLSISVYINLPTYLPTYLSIYLSIYLGLLISIHLCIYLEIPPFSIIYFGYSVYFHSAYTNVTFISSLKEGTTPLFPFSLFKRGLFPPVILSIFSTLGRVRFLGVFAIFLLFNSKKCLLFAFIISMLLPKLFVPSTITFRFPCLLSHRFLPQRF